MRQNKNISLTLRAIAMGVTSGVYILVLFLSVLLSGNTECRAQDKYEVGVFLGGSYYIGDLNMGQHFKDTRPAVGVIGRYVINDRLALKADIVGAMMHAEYPSGGDKYPNYTGEKFEFDKTFFDVGIMGEFHFLSYDHVFFQNRTRFTPYLTAGLGGTIYTSYKDNDDGKQTFSLSLPFGFGVKYKVNSWMRLGLAWTIRKTMVDDFDTSDKMSGVNPNDPFGFKTHVSSHNNDWYSLFGVIVSVSMKPRRLTCNDGSSRNFKM